MSAAELWALAHAEPWSFCVKPEEECRRDPCLWCQARHAELEERRAAGRPPGFIIEVNRGGSWTARAWGELSETVTRKELIAEVRRYCLQYPHRLLIGGKVVAEAEPKRAA